MVDQKFISLAAVGDVCFSGSVESQFFCNNVDPFSNLKDVLNNCDISFCNLECPLTDSDIKQKRHYSKILNSSKCIHLKSELCFSKILRDSNFHIVSLANNHILDYNDNGLFDTIDALNKENISSVGAGKNIFDARNEYIFEKHNIKIGFLAYSYTYEATPKCAGAAPLWKKLIIEDVHKIKSKVDYVVVSLHFGLEFSNVPSKFEKKFAHILIEEGADLILGHHPHVLREIEHYKNGIIVYSLGNFVFDPYISQVDDRNFENTRQSMLIIFKISKDAVKVEVILPIYLSRYGIPSVAPDDKRHTIFNIISGNFLYNNPNISKKSMLLNYFGKFTISLRMIYASIRSREFKNIYFIYKRYLNKV